MVINATKKVDGFSVALVDTFLNHCKGGFIVGRVSPPAKGASAVQSSTFRRQNAAVADRLRAADIHLRIIIHGQFYEEEADLARVSFVSFEAARHQPLLEISRDRVNRRRLRQSSLSGRRGLCPVVHALM